VVFTRLLHLTAQEVDKILVTRTHFGFVLTFESHSRFEPRNHTAPHKNTQCMGGCTIQLETWRIHSGQHLTFAFCNILLPVCAGRDPMQVIVRDNKAASPGEGLPASPCASHRCDDFRRRTIRAWMCVSILPEMLMLFAVRRNRLCRQSPRGVPLTYLTLCLCKRRRLCHSAHTRRC